MAPPPPRATSPARAFGGATASRGRINAVSPPPPPGQKVKDKQKSYQLKKLQEACDKLALELEPLRRQAEAQREQQRQSELRREAAEAREAAAATRLEDLLDGVPNGAGQRAAQWAEGYEELGADVAALREETAAWRQHCDRLQTSVAQQEQERRDLEAEGVEGVYERRQLQAECLSLQQEAEDARLALHEARGLERGAGSSLERMAVQKLELERTMYERSQRAAILHGAMRQAGENLRSEAEAERRRQKEAAANCQRQVDILRAEAAGQRRAAAELQRESSVLEAEVAPMEQSFAARDGDVSAFQDQLNKVRAEVAGEQRLEDAARALLLSAHARREQLERRLSELRGEGALVSSQTLALQEEHARLVLRAARCQAAGALQRIGISAAPATAASDVAEPAVCAGFFMPAGSARMQRMASAATMRGEDARRHGHGYAGEGPKAPTPGVERSSGRREMVRPTRGTTAITAAITAASSPKSPGPWPTGHSSASMLSLSSRPL